MSDAISTPEDDDKAVAQALQDLRDIAELRRSPAWERYFLRRLREKLAPLEEDILNNDSLSDAQRELKRRERKVYDTIIKLLDSDEIGNCSIAGVEVGTQVTDGMPKLAATD